MSRELREVGRDSRGNTLFVQDNGAGGRTYWSDEIGHDVIVWDTSIISKEMLQFAMETEFRLAAVNLRQSQISSSGESAKGA